MELISEDLLKNLPKIHETKDQKEKMLWIRFYTPWVFQSWEVAEYDAKRRLCFGWMRGYEDNWGYFKLDELEKMRGPYGLKVLWDPNFQPGKFYKI